MDPGHPAAAGQDPHTRSECCGAHPGYRLQDPRRSGRGGAGRRLRAVMVALELTAFLDRLRLRGLKIGIDQYVAAERLMAELREAGVTDPERIKGTLAPLLSRSPTE